MTVWVFGDSHSTPFGLDDPLECWTVKLGKRLESDVISHAQAAVDNFYIYQSIMQHIDDIADDDIVIVGWSHSSRKTFVYDKDNPVHQDAFRSSMKYQSGDRMLFRSPGAPAHRITDVLKLTPRKKGYVFFDTWFRDYYNEYEASTQFQSYVDSVKLRLPNAVTFWFSRESVEGLRDTYSQDLFVLDYMLKHNCYIDDTNYHLSNDGHSQWAEKLYERISQ